MLGNNLSQLGVDAGQLDNGLNTWSGEPGLDADHGRVRHERRVRRLRQATTQLATRFGAHYTHSDENRQGQPDTDAFDNVQIRLSDGSVIFTPDLFAPGRPDRRRDLPAWPRSTAESSTAATRSRASTTAGAIDDFRGTGTGRAAVRPSSTTTASRSRLSAMLLPETLQVYAGGSKVFGEYGDPWDARVGRQLVPVEEPGRALELRVHPARPLAGGRPEPAVPRRRQRSGVAHELHALVLRGQV